MNSFISYLISGIGLGSIYALIALGYTMVYGIAKMLNFAHGDVIMVGGYAVFLSISSLNCPVWLSIIIGIVVCTVLGVVIERVAYKPLRNASSLSVLITAIGVSYLLQNLVLNILGSNARTFKSVVSLKTIEINSQLKISGEAVVTIIVTVVIMVALTLFINKTKTGMAMQAVSEDKGAAQLMGINVNKTISIVFAIGSGLAAVAGILLGIIENLSKAYISTQVADAIVFASLIIVLILKPTGLLGKKINEKV